MSALLSRTIVHTLSATVMLAGWLAAQAQAPAGQRTADELLAWPPLTQECRPWSYWWWMGSAVDETNLTRELTRYRDAGWGGVHIIPIYGAKGWEARYLEYLSPKWLAMLKHTVAEGRRLGLGVDMSTGTGWCFGGPNVAGSNACATVVAKTNDVPAGGQLTERFDPQTTQALVAFSSAGECVELTGKIGPDGTVDWRAEGGPWRVYALSQRPTSKVKRAAPGGGGYMLNPFYAGALRHYLERFSQAFAAYDGLKPRAMYHDSFEYGANWSPDLLAQFEKRRGYRLQTELPSLLGDAQTERAARVKADYRETVSDMMIEEAWPVWTGWAREHGLLTRNQAHGSPGNLLDLYALADIPETEMFYADRRPLVAKFASSSAHVAGRKLVAAETGTWLKEHFTETLADVKYLLDDLFVSGVNHVVFHGTCYSPDEAEWPGWLFYASTEMNPRNSIWRDAPTLAAYIARCQAALQTGQPGQDVLLYWPIHDTWHNPGGMQMNFSVHGAAWFVNQPLGRAAQRLWERGFSFDYVSDRQLAGAQTARGRIQVPGGEYGVVAVPACERMPVATLEKLLALAKDGATIVFEGRLPQDVPGLGDLEKRRAAFRELLATVKLTRAADGKIEDARLGGGRVLVGELEAALAAAGATREPLAGHAGLRFIRRRFDGGWHYFIANRGEQAFADWLALAVAAKSAVVMDPMTGQVGVGRARASRDGKAQVYVQLQPGESVLLRLFSERRVRGPAWLWWQPAGEPVEIKGTWQVRFISGGPALPPPLRTGQLASWTHLGGEEAKRFAGTALYTIAFDAPEVAAPAWQLDLGQVCQSARARLNGRDLGTVFLAPFRLPLGLLKPKDNLLEIEVTSLSANRIRDLDRRKVNWKNFHDINFVNLNYKPFDAAAWPLADCGLLGPVRLVPVKQALR